MVLPSPTNRSRYSRRSFLHYLERSEQIETRDAESETKWLAHPISLPWAILCMWDLSSILTHFLSSLSLLIQTISLNVSFGITGSSSYYMGSNETSY